MKNNLAGFSYIYNGIDFDIPFIESIKSVIHIVDEFVLTECYSKDGTWEKCLKLQEEYPNKIKLLRRPWVEHFSEISLLANWTATHIDEDIQYCMQLQSDEVIHEKDLDILRRLPELMNLNNKTAARWRYNHFLGNPSTTFPFCYSELVRVIKRGLGWQIIGDGVQYAKDGSLLPPEEVLETNIQVFHYGKMKDPKKGFKKEVDFQNLFKDVGFPDPKMKEMKEKLGEEYCDYVYLFESNIVDNKIQKFEDSHPLVMHEYLKKFESSGYEQFISKIKDNLNLIKVK